MKKSSLFVLVLLLGMVSNAFSQPGFLNIVKIKSGDLKLLKGQTELNIEYNYDDMKVGDMNEADYISRKVAEMNKAKAGTGDEWKVKWAGDRMNRFEPSFEKYFKKYLLKAKINATQTNANAKYSVIIKTVKTEPGLYTGVSFVEKNTFINVYATFIEKGNPGTELCVIFSEKITGEVSNSFANYDVGLRITNAYQNLGIRLSKFIVKTIK
jgi:hypothetical protein